MTNELITSCLACGLHEPRRNTYFDGKMLLERDFLAEQDYHRGHRHLHNAMLHGTGTVCGLKVIEHPSLDCRRDLVVVESGMAIDCCGQEIVVPERAPVRVRKMIEADPDLRSALDGTRHLVIAICRRDHGDEQVPAILGNCAGDGFPTEYGRVAEGFEFVLSARDPADLVPPNSPFEPRLRWAHTITLGGQVPRRVHLNAEEQLVQIAADAETGITHLHVHDDRTSDLVSQLELPATSDRAVHLTDTASMREARMLLAAGEGFSASTPGGVAFFRRGDISTNARPFRVLPVEGTALRLAVSPVSGTVFILATSEAAGSTLTSYSQASIMTWLETPGDDKPSDPVSLTFDHDFGDATGPAQRGASMFEISHDGRYLALAGPAKENEHRVYLIEVAAFRPGMTQADAAVKEIDQAKAAVALAWSLDDKFLYVLFGEPAPRSTVLHRYQVTGVGNALEKGGQGVSLPGVPHDLALAPTETRAYVLLADEDGISRVTTVDIEQVRAVPTGDEPKALEFSTNTIRIDGDGRSLALATPGGGRLYVAAGDAEVEGQPARGLVAMIEIVEDDCSVHIGRQVDGCPGCQGKQTAGCCGGAAHGDGDGHGVVIAHLPNYRMSENGEGPRMVDRGNEVEGDVAIDNHTYRPIVPSAATLQKVLMCMLARGIDEGPPGPRGDTGKDGRAITEARVDLGAPGSAATANITDNPTGLTLTLGLPEGRQGSPGERGPQGDKGAPGPGIDDARIAYRNIPDPTVVIVEENGKRILDISLPEPPKPKPPVVNSIIALSWKHGTEYPEFRTDFKQGQRGIAVAFSEPVRWDEFVDSSKGTMLVELQRRVHLDRLPGGVGANLFTWATLDRVRPFPILYDPGAIENGLLREWQIAEGAPESAGFALRPEDAAWDFNPGEILRLVFYADFPITITDPRLSLSGGHIRGELPTGEGGAGGTFRSWFAVGQ